MLRLKSGYGKSLTSFGVLNLDFKYKPYGSFTDPSSWFILCITKQLRPMKSSTNWSTEQLKWLVLIINELLSAFIPRYANIFKYSINFSYILSIIPVFYLKCSIRPCKLRREKNAMSVRLFNWSLSQAHSFPCYLRDDTVILNKLRNFSATSHAIFWPAFTAIVSALLLLLFWHLVGCGFWNDEGTHISNSVNEISLTHARV